MNMKKWFLKYFSKPRVSRFFKRYGAVTAGLVCAGIVGIVYAVTWNGSEIQAPEPTANPGVEQPSGADLNDQLSDVEGYTPNPTSAAVTPAPSPTKVTGQQTGVQTNASPIPKMLRPVEGEVVQPFARDALVYSETLKEWSTHLGVDIKADEGDDVAAVLDGTVESIVEDELMGICITISHGDSMKSVYCALSQVSVVKGQKVKRGDIIGKVGNTATCELASGDHLHFEFYLDDKAVNAAPFFLDQ